MKNAILSGSIMIQSSFNDCDIDNIKFNRLVVDEYSLNSLLANKKSLKNDITIKMIGKLNNSAFGIDAINTFSRNELNEMSINTIVKSFYVFAPNVANFILANAMDENFYSISKKN